MAIRILSVMNGSIADRIGIEAGETLLQINGEDIMDDIDYQALTSDEKLVLSVEGKDRVVRTLKIKKKSRMEIRESQCLRRDLSPLILC